jgi:hypothetical protein
MIFFTLEKAPTNRWTASGWHLAEGMLIRAHPLTFVSVWSDDAASSHLKFICNNQDLPDARHRTSVRAADHPQ